VVFALRNSVGREELVSPVIRASILCRQARSASHAHLERLPIPTELDAIFAQQEATALENPLLAQPVLLELTAVLGNTNASIALQAQVPTTSLGPLIVRHVHQDTILLTTVPKFVHNALLDIIRHQGCLHVWDAHLARMELRLERFSVQCVRTLHIMRTQPPHHVLLAIRDTKANSNTDLLNVCRVQWERTVPMEDALTAQQDLLIPRLHK